MFLRALLAFLALPFVAAFIVPPFLAAADPWRAGVLWQGGVVMLLGSALLLWCVRDFHASGRGTLAPWAPPENLVVVGLYRHVRNPMYIGVLTLVAGWSLLLTSPVLALYTAALAIGFHIQVCVKEEPRLSVRFGNDWTRYSTHVARWLPRLKPWGSSGS